MAEEDTKPKRLIEGCKTCDAFFMGTLDEAIRNQRVKISEEVAFYLLQTLVRAFRYAPTDDEKRTIEKAIALRYEEALDKPSRGSKRANEFRAIGDSSLMLSGVWWISLLRKPADVDYYATIGSSSYLIASEESPENLAKIFEELSENFITGINILTEATQCISLSQTNLTNCDILRMYEVYLRTNNPFLARKLISIDINVVPGKTTKQ